MLNIALVDSCMATPYQCLILYDTMRHKPSDFSEQLTQNARNLDIFHEQTVMWALWKYQQDEAPFNN